MRRLRELSVCLIVPSEQDGGRRGIYVAKGQVVCTRPFLGTSGVEWQAALADIARAEPTLAPEAADDLRVLASFMRRPPPELTVAARWHTQRHGGASRASPLGRLAQARRRRRDCDAGRPGARSRAQGRRRRTYRDRRSKLLARAPRRAARRRAQRPPARSRRRPACAPHQEGPLARVPRPAVVGCVAERPPRPAQAAPTSRRSSAVPRDADLARQGASGSALRRAPPPAADLGARPHPSRRCRLWQGLHEPRPRRVRTRGRHSRGARRDRRQPRR